MRARTAWCGALALAAALAWCGGAPAQEPVTGQLGRLQRTYDAELQKLVEGVARRQAALAQQYAKSLAALEQSAQKEGVLEKVLAVRKEKERFAAAGAVEPADHARAYPDLLKLQTGFAAADGTLRVERARGTAGLADLLDAALKKLQTRLTQEGKLDDALAVKQASDALRQRPEVTEAAFVLAEADVAGKAAPPTPAATKADAPKAAEAEPAASGAVGEGTRKSEKQIAKRYERFCAALADEDLDKAVTYMDPRVVSLAGKEAITPHLAKMVPYLKGAKAAGIDIDAGRVEVDSAKGEGVNRPRFWINNTWQQGDPTYWVRVEDEWYVDCRDRKKEDTKAQAGDAR